MKKMKKIGFYIDATSCVGCRTCQIACKDKNNLDVGVFYRKVETYETGDYPNPGYYHYSYSCYHCENPKCVKACPTGAMHRAQDSSVQYDPRLCITCKYCVNACPYKIPGHIKGKAVIAKCDSCKDLRDDGKNPACVDACMMRCIKWGELEEFRAAHNNETLVSDIEILPSSVETRPALLIKPKPAMFDKNPRRQEI